MTACFSPSAATSATMSPTMIEDAVGIDIGGRAGPAKTRACRAPRHGSRPPRSPGSGAARNRTVPASRGRAPPAGLRPVRAETSRSRWRKWCVRMASLFRLVCRILSGKLQRGTIGSFDRRRNRIGSRGIRQNPCCLRYFQLLERRASGHRRWQSSSTFPAHRDSRRRRRGARLIAAVVARGGRLGRHGLRRQQQRAGRQEGRGRLRRRCADRDPDRSHQRQRAVREECRRTAARPPA